MKAFLPPPAAVAGTGRGTEQCRRPGNHRQDQPRRDSHVPQCHHHRQVDFTVSNRTEARKDLRQLDRKDKTFISTVNVPLQFTNCTFTDEVLAYYSVEKENDEGGSEIYKADFNQDVLFEDAPLKGRVLSSIPYLRKKPSLPAVVSITKPVVVK